MPAPGATVGDASPEAEDDDPRRTREYPIAEGEFHRLYGRLTRRDDQLSWFAFDTLDNRLVFINRAELEFFEMVGDDVTPMPSFEHEEVYKALSESAMLDILQGEAPLPDSDDASAPYSGALIKRCLELVEEWGGYEAMVERMSNVTLETRDGCRKTMFFDDDNVFEDISLFSVEIEGSWRSDSALIGDWMIELGSEGYYRSTAYRLGALRLIEVPILAFDAFRASIEASEEDGKDGKS